MSMVERQSIAVRRDEIDDDVLELAGVEPKV